jgi:hypothetical protein
MTIKTIALLIVPCMTFLSMFGCSNEPKDTTAPAILWSGVAEVSSFGAIISWTTDEPATSQVEFRSGDFGLSTDYNLCTILDSKLVTTHDSIGVMELRPGTTYHYRVVSVDKAGNVGTSSDLTFTTKAE